jgi:hypothetical protein
MTKRDGIRLAFFMEVGPYLEERPDLLDKLVMERQSTLFCSKKNNDYEIRPTLWP